MGARSRIIIDTDPGIDDILAMLLALSASPEDVEIILISLTFGNIDVESCIRNVVSLFHHISKEKEWRRENGMPDAFQSVDTYRPVVAVGATEPLTDQRMMADYFHGKDGLGGISDSHPHLSPSDTWRELFAGALSSSKAEKEMVREVQQEGTLFVPSQRPAYEEILRVLRENEPDTISVVVLGPMTNVALAAAKEPEVFLRAKEIVVMGGAIKVPGNMTPVAEFNTYADSFAAARVFALTSPNPLSTMPPVPPAPKNQETAAPPPPFLQPYPASLSRELRLVLLPLDITSPHLLTLSQYESFISAHLAAGSPLAEWATAFMTATFAKHASLHTGAVKISMHDPLCIWYILTGSDPRWRFAVGAPEDIRVEAAGQWSRGMCVVDRRDRRMREEAELVDQAQIAGRVPNDPSDTGNWLSRRSGNRVFRVVGTPGEELFGREFLESVFGAAAAPAA